MAAKNGLHIDGRTTPSFIENTTTRTTSVSIPSETEHLWILWLCLGLLVFIIILIFLCICFYKKGKKLLFKEWIKVNSITQKMLLMKKGWLNPVQKTDWKIIYCKLTLFAYEKFFTRFERARLLKGFLPRTSS